MRSLPSWAAVLALVVVVSCERGSEGTSPASAPTTTPTGATVDALGLTCDGKTTDVDAARVHAATDGVHLAITNTSGSPLGLSWPDGGDDVPEGESEMVLPLMPGRVDLSCHPGTPGHDPSGTRGTRVTVVGPEGWIEPSPDCAGGGARWAIIDYGEGATGVPDPVAAMARHAPDGAEVVPVGYRSDTSMQVGILVDDTVVEVARYFPDGAGGWLVNRRSECMPKATDSPLSRA